MLEAGAGVADRLVAELADRRDVGEHGQIAQRVADQLFGADLLIRGDTLDAREVDRVGGRVPGPRPVVAVVVVGGGAAGADLVGEQIAERAVDVAVRLDAVGVRCRRWRVATAVPSSWACPSATTAPSV